MRIRPIWWLLLGSLVFWMLLFWLVPCPWLLVNFLIAYLVLIAVRCVLTPLPSKSDPLSEL